MIITCVHVYVKTENLKEFIEITKKNNEGTIKEPGNIRFDFVQSADDPSRFMLYEVFKSQADIDFHKTTAHYLSWRDTVAGWMAKPREGVRYHAIVPLDEKQWKYCK
jgi:(4S)-4-hydroxy-5-phosphonooxypentane-2,3-dione isomerase